MNSRSNLLLLQLKWHLTQNIPLKSAGYTGLFQNLPCSSLSIRPRFPVWDLHSTPSLVIYKQLFPPIPHTSKHWASPAPIRREPTCFEVLPLFQDETWNLTFPVNSCPVADGEV